MMRFLHGTTDSGRHALLLAILVGVSVSAPLLAQSDAPLTGARSARTIVYHPRDVVSLHAKLRYTTLIVLPDGEEVVEATSGDKEFWIVNVRGALVSVKPAKAGGETNLNLLTTSGQVYAFVLTEISGAKSTTSAPRRTWPGNRRGGRRRAPAWNSTPR
jgi:type IV secretory pathway VirB9-like protein